MTNAARPRALAATVALAALVLPWVVARLGPAASYMLNLSVIFAIVAIALNLLTGFSGQISLGHAGFLMLGEYASALLTLKAGFPFWAALPASALLVGAIGFLVGLPAVRLSGNFLAVATMGFGLAVPEVMLNWAGLTHGSAGLMPKSPTIGGFSFGSDVAYYYLALFCLALVWYICATLLRSRTGRALQAVRDSEPAALASGINAAYHKALAFAISAAFAGVAGALYAHYVNFVSPNDFSIQDSFLFLAMIVVGGLGSLPGSLLGAVLLTVVSQLSTSLGQFSIILTGSVMLLAVLFFPGGLISLARRRRPTPRVPAPLAQRSAAGGS